GPPRFKAPLKLDFFALATHRQKDRELAAFAYRTFNIQKTAMVFYNLSGYGEAKTGSAGFGGVKKVAHVAYYIFGDAGAVVGDFNNGHLFLKSCGYVYFSITSDGLHCILHDVE